GLGDLAQIAPIAIVMVTLLVAMLADLILPARRRGPVVAALAVLGLTVALAAALYRWQVGGGHSAYYGFATGDSFAVFFEVLLSILGILTVLVSHPQDR